MAAARDQGWTIEFYADEQGRCEVLDLIDALPQGDRAKVRGTLRLLLEYPLQLREPHAKPLTGHSPLRELTPGDIRVIYFAHKGHRFIVLHAFRKKSQKTPQKEIRLAESRMAAFLEREQT